MERYLDVDVLMIWLLDLFDLEENEEEDVVEEEEDVVRLELK